MPRVLRALLASAVLIGSPTLPAAVATDSLAGAAAGSAAGGERYVALGDSAAAGPIILPLQPGPLLCMRSARNFPSVVAAALGVGSFTDVTCSSATIDDLSQSQASGVQPQLDALRSNTTLVTLGPVGANDAELFGTVLGCLVPGCKERAGTTVHKAIEGIRPKLRAALGSIKRRSPGAAVVVVGYGRYLPAGGCPLVQPFTASDADYIQGLVNHVNRILRERAKAAGAVFADLRRAPGALDHTICAPVGQRWFEGLIPLSGDGAVPFHPTALGMAAFAEPVASAVQRARQAQAKVAAEQVRLTRRCRPSGNVRLRARNVTALVSRVDFKIGRRTVKRDRSAPFKVVVDRRRLARLPGRMRAVVHATRPGAHATARLVRQRPPCTR